jgi:hypothetical protein
MENGTAAVDPFLDAHPHLYPPPQHIGLANAKGLRLQGRCGLSIARSRCRYCSGAIGRWFVQVPIRQVSMTTRVAPRSDNWARDCVPVH